MSCQQSIYVFFYLQKIILDQFEILKVKNIPFAHFQPVYFTFEKHNDW